MATGYFRAFVKSILNLQLLAATLEAGALGPKLLNGLSVALLVLGREGL